MNRSTEKVTYREVGVPTKKINISNRVQLSFDEKERIANQIPLYKGNIGQIYAIPKFIKEEIERKKSSTLHLVVWTTYFKHRYSIKLSRTSMDLKIIKPHQCSLERSHAVLIELKE